MKKRSVNPIWDLLKKLNPEPTREKYLAIDRWEPNPKLGPEEEAELPPQFRAKETSGDRNRLRNRQRFRSAVNVVLTVARIDYS